MKIKIIVLSLLLAVVAAGFSSCDKSDDPDTGTCTDGIKNQDEEEIDCGGICPPCEADSGMSASVSGYAWNAADIQAVASGGTLTITAHNGIIPMWIMTIVHTGEFKTGTYSLNPLTDITNLAGDPYTFTSGSITFTKFDTAKKTISGTFAYNASGDPFNLQITNGVFSNVVYQ